VQRQERIHGIAQDSNDQLAVRQFALLQASLR
jgi:hypothetical protein